MQFGLRTMRLRLQGEPGGALPLPPDPQQRLAQVEALTDLDQLVQDAANEEIEIVGRVVVDPEHRGAHRGARAADPAGSGRPSPVRGVDAPCLRPGPQSGLDPWRRSSLAWIPGVEGLRYTWSRL